jgi:fatty-acyl-CoA synthase
VSAQDVAQIQYTSGTTGRPKGAELTHLGIVNNARQSAALWRVGPDDRWCNPLPLFHTAGCAMLALGAVAAGATHLPLIRFDPERVLATIETERATIVETVPTILTALLDRQQVVGADLSSLRLVGTSGAPTPRDLGTRCADEWQVPLRVLYGSTEVSPTASGTALDEPGDLGWTTVGRPLPGTEVRVVDPRTGQTLALDQPGELQVRGYQVMAGYHDRPDATAGAITADGWYRTGDLARLDADGYLHIVGRLRDVIIRGGENLYPAEIEEVLRTNPAVADAAVIGVPDPFFGEEACAVVVARDGAAIDGDDLRQWARERMTHQKVPRYVSVVAALPQTASGKVQKFLLRDEILAGLTTTGDER